MEFVYTSHRFAGQIIKRTPELELLYTEITDSIAEITDEELIDEFENGEKGPAKSLSYAINALLRKHLHDERGWKKEAQIFQGREYSNVWRLDSEVNHIEKSDEVDIGSGIGIIITASSDLKAAGGFDGAVGEYEKVLRYLKPMHNQLTVPMMVIGLKAPKTFRLETVKNPVTGRSASQVVSI